MIVGPNGTLSPRPHTWNAKYNLLIVDNPGSEEFGTRDRALHFGRGAHNRAFLHAGGSSALALQVDALRAPTRMLRARTQGPARGAHLEQLALLGAAGDPSSIAGWVGSAATRAELEYQMASSPVGWLGRDERTASQVVQTDETEARRFADALPDKLLKGPTAIQVIGRALNTH